MAKKTSLNVAHLQSNAVMVDFFGWEMPLHYGSQVEEHKKVRSDAGMFDVSHMTIVDINGKDAKPFLLRLLANNIEKCKTPGKALYSVMLNENGGVIDDLIAYYFSDTQYRLVVNSATREKDLAWIQKVAASFAINITERNDLAIIAIQGPHAIAKTISLLPKTLQEPAKNLKVFSSCQDQDWLVARTGYTGEDGFEIMLPQTQAIAFWNALLAASIAPCGLGARDTLRLEAGMNLYGQDMDENISPLAANLAWTIALEPHHRDFIGRKALENLQQNGVPQKLVGLIMTERGVMRPHQKIIIEGVGEGEITSGTFSPTLNCSIAFARIPACENKTAHVEIRGKLFSVTIVTPPFVRHGQSCIDIKGAS